MDFTRFFISGINYKKTDASIRGSFAVNTGQYNALLQQAGENDIKEIFVLSTCNRTEIYALAPSEDALATLLCNHTIGTKETFQKLCYTKQGKDAIEHLFAVAAGLDSQILGDYEIVGQIKQAVKQAKEQGYIGAFLERLFNSVLQSSKAIKNQTQLSGGTVSVSFAAIQYLKQVQNISQKKIVLLGTGKIGSSTCKNLVDYLNNRNITVLNRTEGKAEELAAELGLQAVPYEELYAQIGAADIVIVATNATTPIIVKDDLLHTSPKILIDLSIPNNIDSLAGELPHITLVNVDDLSKINDETLQKRLTEVPKAKHIISEHIAEFSDWYKMRKNVPVIKAVKQKLLDLQQTNTTVSHSDELIHKVVSNMATKMRRQHRPGCNYIEAINDYMAYAD